jgi:hypothetical protein
MIYRVAAEDVYAKEDVAEVAHFTADIAKARRRGFLGLAAGAALVIGIGSAAFALSRYPQPGEKEVANIRLGDAIGRKSSTALYELTPRCGGVDLSAKCWSVFPDADERTRARFGAGPR